MIKSQKSGFAIPSFFSINFRTYSKISITSPTLKNAMKIESYFKHISATTLYNINSHSIILYYSWEQEITDSEHRYKSLKAPPFFIPLEPQETHPLNIGINLWSIQNIPSDSLLVPFLPDMISYLADQNGKGCVHII